MCRSHHLVNAHEVKPVRLIQSLCAVCGSNLAGLTLLYIVLPCMADVSIVNCTVCQQFNKRTLLLLLLLLLLFPVTMSPWVTPNYPKPPHFPHFVLPFSLWVELETPHLIDRLTVASASLQMTNHPWNGRGQITNFYLHQPRLWNGWSYSGQILYTGRLCQVPAYGWQITLKGAWSGSHDPF